MVKPYSKKKHWMEIKHHVKELNHEFYSIINELITDEIIYELSYPYGFKISDYKHFNLPDENGNIEKIDLSKFPYLLCINKKNDLILESDRKLIPDSIYGKCDIFPKTAKSKFLEVKTRPDSPFTVYSGIRDVYISTLNYNIEAYSRYNHKHNFNLNIHTETHSDHYKVIKSVSENTGYKWESKFYMFDENIIKKIWNDKRWIDLRIYFYQQDSILSKRISNSMFLDYALSEICLNHSLIMKPYTIEIIKKIFNIALKIVPAYSVSLGNDGLPLEGFIDDYLENYKVNYIPIIYENSYLNNNTVYLSISSVNQPLVDKKSFKSIIYLSEVKKYIYFILDKISEHPLTKETSYAKLRDIIELGFYSAQGSKKENLSSIHEMYEVNKEFEYYKKKAKAHGVISFNTRSYFNQSIISLKFKN